MAGDFAQTFEERLAALSRTNNALSFEGSVDLASLIEQELSGASVVLSKFTLNGPRVAIGHGCAFALGLLFHELSCNAARYGSLSVPEGHVDVSWQVQTGALDLTWVESGGPPVQRPSSLGMGNFLIKHTAAKLEGSADLLYLHSGLRCELRVSLCARWPNRQAGILLAEGVPSSAAIRRDELRLAT